MYDAEKGVSYVGVVARLESGEEVFYQPIEIATFWGKWTEQTSVFHKLWISLIFGVAVLICLLWWRKCSKQGYVPLSEYP